MSKICSLKEAVSGIQDGQTVASVGVIGWITPDELLKGLGDRFDQGDGPRDLTFYFPCGTGDAMDIGGMDRVAKKGLMKRIVSGSFINPVHPITGERPKLMQLIKQNAIEAYSWPIGASMQWLREVARKSPGYLTKIGLGSYIDPAQDGGRLTTLTTEDLVEKVSFKGEDYLFYRSWPIHHCFIRASSSDEFGNLSFEDEGLMSSALALALATKACGGTVVAPDQVMVTDTPHDTRYLSPARLQLDTLPKIPFGADKIIGRRAYMEVPKHTLTILGFGASSDMPLVMVEDGALNEQNMHEYRFTTEHGSYGGVVMTGWQFSTNMWPEALVDGVTQFDAIDGGLCECTALAFAEFDASGNVNVSKFGAANPGAGGFIDIAHNASKLIFTGTFTAGGLSISSDDGVLRIDKEGKNKKFVAHRSHIALCAFSACAKGVGASDESDACMRFTRQMVHGRGDACALVQRYNGGRQGGMPPQQLHGGNGVQQ
jgi:propionate CoA-transferase